MTPLISGLASVASMLFSSSSGANASARKVTDATPEASAKVILSSDAEAIARFASKGVAVAVRSTTQLGTAGAVTRSTQTTANEANQPVTKDDFRRLLAEFGASEAQQAQLAEGFDTDQDGTISRDEFLQRVAGTTGKAADSNFTQSLLALIDQHGNANGVVNQKEFVQFTTAFVDAQMRKVA